VGHSNSAIPTPPSGTTHTVKVKAHRGDPLDGEADIRSEVGLRKEQKEVIWNNPTNRNIYQWSVGPITTSTTWNNTVRNRFRQKAGEIEAFRALQIEVAKWCKEHIPHKDNDLTDEELLLLDDMELLWEKQNLLWSCHESRKKDRMNTDGTFLPHRQGAISRYQQPLQATGTYARENVETSWGSG
jgi:hypothetical protein